MTKPFANCYWIEPGRLLAGEYPTPEQLNALVSAQFSTLIDFTRPGEMSSYESYVRHQEGVVCLRFAIVDHGVPNSPAVVSRALDAIDEALAAGRNVYVHCRAGIGRTGMMMGCYLIRRGYSGDAALQRLNVLWRECGRAVHWPCIPETPEQIAFVQKWYETSRPATAPSPLSTVDRYQGAMLGLALGDALGSARSKGHSAGMPDSDVFKEDAPDLPRGAWTADTAMTLCVAESLLACGTVDLEDHLIRYLHWQRTGEPSSTGVALNVPAELERALATWQWSRKPLSSSHDPKKRDPHTLARTLPVAMYFASEPAHVIDQAAEVSRATLQSPPVLDAARVCGALLLDALQGRDKNDILELDKTPAARVLRSRFLKRETQKFLLGGWRRLTHMPQEGDAMVLMSATLRTFERTEEFAVGLLAAVSESPVPAHAGAVFGALAGAHYGLAGIPPEWRGVAIGEQKLMAIAEALLKAAAL